MVSCRLQAYANVWVAVLFSTLVGCAAPPRQLEPARYTDDFGETMDTELITEESVGATQMLHQRARLEPYARAVIPFDSNFDPGSAIGFKAQIEVQKHLFIGFNFDWVHLESDDDISDAVNNGNLLSVDATEFYESMDRFNILAGFDYEFELTDAFIKPDKALTLDLGLGAGLTIITGDEADSAFISSFDLEPFFSFILRPSATLNWHVTENGFWTLGASFDWVPEGNIDIDFLGERSQVDDDIDFSSFNIGMGFQFIF